MITRSYKTSETLLGIETLITVLPNAACVATKLQNLWNPFRDWNIEEIVKGRIEKEATKPLKPF